MARTDLKNHPCWVMLYPEEQLLAARARCTLWAAPTLVGTPALWTPAVLVSSPPWLGHRKGRGFDWPTTQEQQAWNPGHSCHNSPL